MKPTMWFPETCNINRLPVQFPITSSGISEESKETVEWADEKEGPFTHQDLLSDNDNQVLKLISKISTSEAIPERKRISNRLINMFQYTKEEDPTNIGIAIISLLNFYIFFQFNYEFSNDRVRCPLISLIPNNTIYVSWRGENNRVFSVHFLATLWDANFVILKPNDRHPDRQEQFYGTTTVDMVVKKAEQYGTLTWVKE